MTFHRLDRRLRKIEGVHSGHNPEDFTFVAIRKLGDLDENGGEREAYACAFDGKGHNYQFPDPRPSSVKEAEVRFVETLISGR